MHAPFIAYLSSAQQIFQESYGTGALFPLYFGTLAPAIGSASLVNGRLVLKHGMRRLSRAATVSITLGSVVAWTLAFAFEGLPPLWLFMAYLLSVFLCIGLLFGNLNALAMEPLGHLAGVGAAVVTSLSIFILVTARSARGAKLRWDHVRPDRRLRGLRSSVPRCNEMGRGRWGGTPAYPPYISVMIRRSCAASSADNRVQQPPNALLADRAYLVDGNFRFFPRTLNL